MWEGSGHVPAIPGAEGSHWNRKEKKDEVSGRNGDFTGCVRTLQLRALRVLGDCVFSPINADQLISLQQVKRQQLIGGSFVIHGIIGSHQVIVRDLVKKG